MQFSQIVGQQSVIRDLLHLYQSNKLPHALLFLGRQGWGTLPLAIAFAKYVMCAQKNETDSCGQCSSCMQIQKLQHPDLHFSFPSKAPKPSSKNLSEHYIQDFREFMHHHPYGSTFDWLQFINVEKQGNISADEARKIIDSMNLKSYQGGYKIHILWRPEFLGKEGNILLKLIEEPPPGTLLMLVAEEEEKILPTILSRMQLIRTKPVLTSEISEALEDSFRIDPDRAGQIALAAEGDYTKALHLKENWNNDMLPLISSWLNAIFTNNGKQIYEWVEAQSQLGIEPLKNLFQYIQQLFSGGLRLTLYANFPLHLSEQEIVFARKLAGLNLSIEAYQMIDQGFTDFIHHTSRNVNIKTSLLNLSVHMQYWVKNRDLLPQA